MIAVERARQQLVDLGLSQAASILDSRLEAASQKDLTYADFLTDLLDAELAARRERYITARTRLAHLPFHKTLDQFDFSFQPSIDEVGCRPFDSVGAAMLFQLVSARYERGAIILTSNKGFGEWGEIFGDTVVATAILDRLLHHSHIINIRGESWRLREKKRAGLFGTTYSRPAAKPGVGENPTGQSGGADVFLDLTHSLEPACIPSGFFRRATS